ncbi:TFIIH C1-like domain containing protein [Parasponia andersonii]|uniref:TFIIH C1-like domain containing protein n=1 Tax=Parasponia andersonii TaxID=3476 RepID=A0A2P5A6A9_PARAD|nr:TFIIH C1-like domain containing protein [Parasponia andersonii]
MGNVEIPKWLEGLPLAPVFRPTDTEFTDPIAYISKIEKEAGAFGICKIIPPLPKPSKKYVFSNLNKSLLKCPELGSHGNSLNDRSSKLGSLDGSNDEEVRAVFTTRQQELGQNVKKTKGAVPNPPSGVHKQVWQSGEIYTLEQFESKSKTFAKSQLGMIKEVSPLVIEAVFWKASSEKPIYVEYANDVPGSGFGEPEGQFRYFHRRRRKRNFYRRSRESSSRNKNDVATNGIDILRTDDVKDASHMNSSDISHSPTSVPLLPSNETSQSSKRKSQNSCHDMEGTAGWKLSNSPWNLQVISRSPGSLTRFMPDDIPGVTSPMVYIGMLFSWFAWHVEDHELHSMNYLHTGSSKTWYAVPGDYAFAFEEVVRSEAYGGNIDRLAALTLLGEKTTLVSPEVVVASGIPCCRLIQNPGEFVVTFPRAYHVGFSHGFNCGEAANFGTPLWLKVAKEAAVRRAAMNYLPMLSHQQLLYLLTMSFVSRVPRSLLPGVRSSRLKDRQKEERELLVKKAFIEDILNENNILSVLLGKDLNYHAVLWNPDLLTYPSKETVSPSAGATISTTATENASCVDSGKRDNEQHYLLDDMSLYMENSNDLYLGSDDLSCDFQVDSGTLACVACGILGFPFMSVVQPSEKASLELLCDNHLLVQECPGVSGYLNSFIAVDPGASNNGCITENLPPVSNSLSAMDLSVPSAIKFDHGQNTCNKFLRPRSFCLEHAVEIVDMLQCKGGAKVLVICHSDYQKIKAHAAAIAEEIGSPFNYSEVPLDVASKEDLNLIDLAIDDDGHDECDKDWTSKLGINLRHCVKIRKNSSSKQVQHALTLGGLLSDKCSSSDSISLKWQLRRSRTKKIYYPARIKPCHSAQLKKNGVVGETSLTHKKEKKLLQYSRRKFKTKPGGSTEAGKVRGRHDTVGDLDELRRRVSENNVCNVGNSTSFKFSALERMSETQNENHTPEATRDESLKVSVGSVENQIENHILEEINMDGKAHHLATLDGSETQDEPNVQTQKITNKLGEKQHPCPSSHITETCFKLRGDQDVEGKFNTTNEACNFVFEGHSNVEAQEGVLTDKNSDLTKMTTSQVVDPCNHNFGGQIENVAVEKVSTSAKVCVSIHVDNEVALVVHATRVKDEKPVSYNCTVLEDHNFASNGECSRDPRVICSTNDPRNGTALEVKPQEEIKTRMIECRPASVEETSEAPCKTHTTEDFNNNICLGDQPQPEIKAVISEPIPVLLEETSEILSDLCAAAKLCCGLTSEETLQQKFGTSDGSSEELASSSVTQMEVHHYCVSVEEHSDVPRANSGQDYLGTDVTSENGLHQETLMTNGEQGSAPILVTQTIDELTPVNAGEFELPKSPKGNLGDGFLSDNNKERKSEKDALPTVISFQKYSRVKRETHATEDLCNGSEVCSSHDDREMDNSKSNDVDTSSNPVKGRKRKREIDLLTENKFSCNGFSRSPCEGLRPRTGKDAASCRNDILREIEGKPATKVKKPSNVRVPPKDKKENSRKSNKCDLEGCRMSFDTKAELMLHKRNRCPHEGCGKRFSSHKYAMIHHRVHDDQRPLKCPWKGCSMSFKWAWARTEHIRVHTGERPYKCKIEGCGLSFRFVSDFSRHRRKTGHYVN